MYKMYFKLETGEKITNPTSVDTLYVQHVSTEETGRQPSTTKIQSSLP